MTNTTVDWKEYNSEYKLYKSFQSTVVFVIIYKHDN